MAVEPETFKAVMGQWPSGVTVVTTRDADGPAGMTASSFSSVSLDPPLISICVARHLAMHARLENAGVFAVNILSKDNIESGQRFAGMLRDVTDRFDGVPVSTAVTGSPLLTGTLGWVDCRSWARYDGGDHTIFVGEVLAAGIDPTAAPLLYHSRAWGQFADVLASRVRLCRAGAEPGAAVVMRAFGAAADRPDAVETIVERVRAALAAAQPALPELLILDDAVAAADPLLVRQTLQAIGRLVGRTPVALRPGAGPMALANVVVALKSGVQHLAVSADAAGPYVAEADVRTMLARMGVDIIG
jgi:flavin reductase (DIM6/NTAB) family NADH-FMN oxidoreductase RutF